MPPCRKTQLNADALNHTRTTTRHTPHPHRRRSWTTSPTTITTVDNNSHFTHVDDDDSHVTHIIDVDNAGPRCDRR